MTAPASAALRRYNAFLLLVAGLGGLLYGIDVGIIGSAYPYLEATSHLSPDLLSDIVAAVLLGSVFSTLFAGLLADWMGRKRLMILSGLIFVASIPIIALASGFGPLLAGRLLQGISGGLIGIVVPLYLAECLSASNRGKGTGIFQWLLTLGIVAAAAIGVYFSYRVAFVARTASPDALFHFKDLAWRSIFWVSLPPGLLFAFGSFFVTESPRWLFRKGRLDQARAALLRSRTPEQADLEMEEMASVAAAAQSASLGSKTRDSLLRRKYVIPFLLACAILFLNQGTGINSIIGYNTGILLQSGLSDLAAHWGYVLFTTVNFVLTMVGMQFVDRRGRRFLILLGTGGVIASLVGVGLLFIQSEKATVNAAAAVQAQVSPDQSLSLKFSPAQAQQLLSGQSEAKKIASDRAALTVIYSYGDFIAATNSVRSDDPAAEPIEISRAACVPANRVEALFKNPFADLDAARTAPLKIQKAIVGEIPSTHHGWLVALGLYCFIAFYAFGPGVVVWLALSELMPTRIRSNGMSIALVLNQLLSATLAGIFLPFVGRWGYSSIFFLFAAFTIVYFLIALSFLPETKGKTLEEIEAHFEGRAS
ncbi:MAG: MFS transporter [Terracidiphilus sp.]|nr:MFS transporter [Terracidiphilus sp.]